MSLKKIVLKNTTALSLHDRFTYLRQHDRVAEVAAGPSARIETMRQARANLQRASAKNRRLAMQMENRPAVAAALRIKKRNMRQRVGLAALQQQQNTPFGNVRERLTLPTRSRLGWRGRGRGANRAANNGGMRSAAMIRTGRGRGASFGFNRPQRIQQRVTTGNNFRARGQNRPRGGMRGVAGVVRGAMNYYTPRGRGGSPVRNFATGFNNNNNNNRRGNQRGFVNQQQLRGGPRGRSQMRGGRGVQMRGGRGQMRGGRGQTRGRVQQRGGRGRGGRGQRQPVPTRDELDTELDAYMAGTKAQLDKDLDQYMNIQM